MSPKSSTRAPAARACPKSAFALRRPERPRFIDHQHATRLEPVAPTLEFRQQLRDGARIDGRFLSKRARRVTRDRRAGHAKPGLVVRRRDVALQTRLAGTRNARDDREIRSAPSCA